MPANVGAKNTYYNKRMKCPISHLFNRSSQGILFQLTFQENEHHVHIVPGMTSQKEVANVLKANINYG